MKITSSYFPLLKHIRLLKDGVNFTGFVMDGNTIKRYNVVFQLRNRKFVQNLC